MTEVYSPRVRTRIVILLAVAAALAGVGLFGSLTVASVIGARLSSRALAGLPAASFSLGLALAPIPLSALMNRFGRRPGLTLGYLLGTLGGAVAAAATEMENVLVLHLGMFLLGVMYSACFLSRYAAGDVATLQTRGRNISFITWALVIGAVLGPNLIEVSGEWISHTGLNELAGPFVMAFGGGVLATLTIAVFLRPDPLRIANAQPGAAGSGPTDQPREVAKESGFGVAVALLGMGVVQIVMVMVMSITAVHVADHHSGFGFAGLVVSAHFFGMFGLSPIAGLVTDRLGSSSGMALGQAVTATGALVGALWPVDTIALVASLFVIGFGWNLNVVGGSALLTDSVSRVRRPKMQGLADFVNGSASVAASLVAGLIFAGLGFAGLSGIAAALVAVPLLLVAFGRRPPQAT